MPQLQAHLSSTDITNKTFRIIGDDAVHSHSKGVFPAALTVDSPGIDRKTLFMRPIHRIFADFAKARIPARSPQGAGIGANIRHYRHIEEGDFIIRGFFVKALQELMIKRDHGDGVFMLVGRKQGDKIVFEIVVFNRGVF